MYLRSDWEAMYTFEEVKKYHHQIKSDINHLLSSLEERIIEARDNEALPVYLTKYRMKSLDSLYLKTKRKDKDLEEITDLGGFRVLCLFEQDIFIVNEFLCRLLYKDGYKLSEFIVFNWKNDKDKEQLTLSAINRFGEDFIKEQPSKASGYKSIHYVLIKSVGENTCNIEIQLRTLLQDVWGELEHALAYKQGSIHPHIKKSFSLLASDLETKDKLVSHLKEVYQNEKTIELFGLNNAGPYRVFGYEDECVPELFTTEENQRLHQEYVKYIEDEVNRRKFNTLEWRKEALALFESLTASITVKQAEDKHLAYWLKAERAFIEFASFHMDAALELYAEVSKIYHNRYVPFFRKGEILFIQGKIEEALVAFDMAEAILDKHPNHNLINEYRLKVKLANNYWLLGDEYMNLTLAKISEAKDIFNHHETDFSVADKVSLYNNLCWYELEVFLKSEKDTDFDKADKTHAMLNTMIKETPDIISNALDTSAWFLYQKYLKTKDRSFLHEAQKRCKLSWGRKNAATNTVLSSNIHRNHIHTIMGA